jgi:nucleoside 2-deoxyribosyltransferase
MLGTLLVSRNSLTISTIASLNPTSVNTHPSSFAMTTPKKTLTYYHAGPLFTVADLTTNITLSSLISNLTSPALTSNLSAPLTPPSQHHFSPLLPQTLEPRSLHPHSIRDTDLRAVLSCDLALFIYDGSELDSGTVVEYMMAKFADIPSVICRTDFRGGGDQGQLSSDGGEAAVGSSGDPWNLMSSFWPRTKTVRVDSMNIYKEALSEALSLQKEKDVVAANDIAAEALLRYTAERVVVAMEEVVALPPRLPVHLREGVFEWIAGMVGWREDRGTIQVSEEMRKVLEEKVNRGML